MITAALVRGILILSVALLAIIVVNPAPYVPVVFIFMLSVSAIWAIGYAMIWLPIQTAAVTWAQPHGRGAAQGALNSSVAMANVVGYSLGGLLIASLGYTTAFIFAAIVAMLAILVFLRIDLQ